MTIDSIPVYGEKLVDKDGVALPGFQSYLDDITEVVSALHNLVDTTGSNLTWNGSTLTVNGDIVFSGLPTSDPLVAGELWNNLGVLTVSAG